MTHVRNHLTGQAGVFRVASELLLRGLHPMLPSVDHGVDLYVEGGARIQVKASNHITTTGRTSFYLAHGYRMSKDGTIACAAPIFSKLCDFVILWGIARDRFWIVPAMTLDGFKSCAVGGTRYQSVASPEMVVEIRRLRESGLNRARVASIVGLTSHTVRHIDRNPSYGKIRGYHGTEHGLVEQVEECEDKWEKVLEFTRVVRELETSEVPYSV